METIIQTKNSIPPRINDCQRVREHLLRHGSITPMQALEEFGCYRLGARIFELRHNYGMNIKTEQMRSADGEHYAKYVLIQDTLF